MVLLSREQDRYEYPDHSLDFIKVMKVGFPHFVINFLIFFV